MPNSKISKTMPAQALAPVGASSRLTPMAIAFEFLDISPMGRNGCRPWISRKDDVAFECGKMVMDLLKLRPAAPPNHHAEIDWKMPLPRSRRPAARRMRCCICSPSRAKQTCKLSIDDFDKINRKVPLLADLKPGGRFNASDLYAAGGTTLVAKRLLDAGILHAGQPTVTGRTIGEEGQDIKETSGQQVLRP